RTDRIGHMERALSPGSAHSDPAGDVPCSHGPGAPTASVPSWVPTVDSCGDAPPAEVVPNERVEGARAGDRRRWIHWQPSQRVLGAAWRGGTRGGALQLAQRLGL